MFDEEHRRVRRRGEPGASPLDQGLIGALERHLLGGGRRGVTRPQEHRALRAEDLAEIPLDEEHAIGGVGRQVGQQRCDDLDDAAATGAQKTGVRRIAFTAASSK